MTPTPVLHHLNFKTVRLQEMIDWYGVVVGARVTFQFEGGAWLTNDSANHRIALLTVPGLEDDPDRIMHTGLHHSAFEYQSVGDLLSDYARLRDHGITPIACLDHGMTTSFYYQDPDGNAVELQSDNFESWERSTAFMHDAPEFAKDPIGTAVDPERMLEELRNGVSADDLHQRGYAGEFDPNTPLVTLLPPSAQ
jgi:catechol 2,3-dioxygenase